MTMLCNAVVLLGMYKHAPLPVRHSPCTHCVSHREGCVVRAGLAATITRFIAVTFLPTLVCCFPSLTRYQLVAQAVGE